MDDSLLADLAAEHAALDRLLGLVAPTDWDLPTPSAGWVIADQVQHLTVGNRLAVKAFRGEPGTAFSGERAHAPERSPDGGVVLAEWRASCAEVIAGAEAIDSRATVTWGAGTMSARSLVTARLMECWAHGLDCHAALGVDPVDSDRLRHVAHLTHRALAYAFRVAGEEPPAPLEDLRLDLIGPAGDRWRYGQDHAPQVITGPAGEWCRVGVKRMAAADARGMRATGVLAHAALRVARAYV